MESSNMSMLSNSIKMQILLSRGNIVLRNIFLDRWSKYNGSDWDESSARPFTAGIGKKVYDKLQRIQRKSVESGDLNEWDLTTLTDVLMLTHFSTDRRTKAAKTLEMSKLEELKKVRNKLVHAPTLGIEDEVFEVLWENASEVLIFLGCQKEDLDEIKFSTNLSVFQDENSCGHVDRANKEEATRLKNDANDFYKNGEFKKAIEVYSKAISLRGLLDSELAVLYSNRSAAYLKSGEKNNRHENSEDIHCALQDGKEAIKLNPTWYRGYIRTANAYFELGKFREALGHFDNALSLCPSSEELRQARDNCRMKIGQEARREHLDPAMMPRSQADQLKEMETRFGIPATDLDFTILEWANGFMNEFIPGYTYVKQAHSIMNAIGTSKDPEMAAKLYAKAASLGNADGMYSLGLLYKKGEGVKQDLKMYIKLMKQAASQPDMIPGTKFKNVGVASAEHSLGLAYQEGIGVKQDMCKAMEWYQKSSEHGCPNASNNLGFLHMSEHGIPLNIERGVQYWKLAANQGNSLAMHTLANHYLEIEKDPREAKEWYERAVKRGNLAAQLERVEFEEKLKKVEEENQVVEDHLVEWEKESSLSGNGMTFKSRMKRMMRAIDPVFTGAIDGMDSIHLSSIEKGSTPRCAPHDFDPIVLHKYAQNGSRTANQILTSMSRFHYVRKLLLDMRGD